MVTIEQSPSAIHAFGSFAFMAGKMQGLAEDASAFGRRWTTSKEQLAETAYLLHADDYNNIARTVGFLKTQFVHAGPRVDNMAEQIQRHFGYEYADDMISMFGRISSVKKIFQNGNASPDLRALYNRLPNTNTVEFVLGKLDHRIRSLTWLARTIAQEEGNFSANPTNLNEFKVGYYKDRLKEAEVSCYNLAKILFVRAPNHASLVLEMFGNCDQVVCAYNHPHTN